MKVLAIDSSPRDGSMNMLLGPYLEGIRAAGGEVEVYRGRDLVIYPCCGNLNCTVRTPGKCMAYDDMRWLRPRIGRADVLVLASPRYFDGVIGHETSSLKSIKAKLVPGMEPAMDHTYEHAVHTTREAVRLRKVVLVSGGGYWEIDGLNPVLTHIKAFCTNSYPGLEGSLPEPRKAILRGELRLGASGSEVETAAKEAGRKLVEACKKKALLAPLPAGSSRVRVEWKDLILFQF
jgi:NADPH-dependent FMN reductase